MQLLIPRNRIQRVVVPIMELLQPVARSLRQQRMVSTLKFNISRLRRALKRVYY